jgi:hypothetical protein
VVFTHTFDVAQYVAALIGEEKWNDRSIIIGDKLTWNDLVSLAETTKGLYMHCSAQIMIFSDLGIPGTKFNVTYDGEETLKAFHVANFPRILLCIPFSPRNSFSMFWPY